MDGKNALLGATETNFKALLKDCEASKCVHTYSGIIYIYRYINYTTLLTSKDQLEIMSRAWGFWIPLV